jgi:hypothetical protein
MDSQQNPTDQLPEKLLYHYSSPGGLLGMMESKSIWMSNIRYQNDSEEYNHIFKVFKKVIEEEYPGFDSKQYFRSEDDRGAFVPPIFTFSLTENKDLLSQWRGYCPKGGYSFGFNRDQLNVFIKRFNLSIHQCIYNEDAQRKIIREQVIRFSPQEWADINSGRKQTDSAFMYGLKYMWLRLARLAPVLKHHAFEEEVEWRIIKDFEGSGPDSRPLEQHPAFNYFKAKPRSETEAMGDGQFLKFREDKGILIPYLSLPLVDLADPYQFVQISEVVIAPGVHQQLAKPACESMLRSWGVWCPVNFSIAPYRE